MLIIIGLGVTLLRQISGVHRETNSSGILVVLYRCHLVSPANSDLTLALLLGLNLILGLQTRRCLRLLRIHASLLGYDEPGFLRYYLHQYWALSLVGDHGDG